MGPISSSENHKGFEFTTRLSPRSPGLCPASLQKPWHTHQKTETGHFDSQPSLGQRNFDQPPLPRFRPVRGHLPEPQPGLPRISDLGGEAGWISAQDLSLPHMST